MPTHRRPLIVLVLTLAVALLCGCKEAQEKPGGQAGGAAPAKPGYTPQTYEGVTFQYPSGWSSAPSEEGKAQMVAAPDADGEWPPFVSFRVFENLPTPDLQKAVDDATVTLQRKDRFTLKEKTVGPHPGGFPYGRVEYTSERGTISLTQWEILIPISGNKRLVVHANATTEDWPKYRPVFAEIVDSIRLPS